MSLQKEKAAAPTAAQKDIQRNEVYRNTLSQSSGTAREHLGELLLALHAPLSLKRKQQLWRAFELKLRQYLDLRDCGVTP